MTYLSKHRELLHQQMSTLCFASTAFPADHNTLHRQAHIVGYFKNVKQNETNRMFDSFKTTSPTRNHLSAVA